MPRYILRLTDMDGTVLFRAFSGPSYAWQVQLWREAVDFIVREYDVHEDKVGCDDGEDGSFITVEDWPGQPPSRICKFQTEWRG